MGNNIPAGLMLGNCEGSILLTMRMGITEIVECLRGLDNIVAEFLVGETIAVSIANELIRGALEDHDEYERIISRMPTNLSRTVEWITQSLLAMEEGFVRRHMFEMVMRIIANAVMEIRVVYYLIMCTKESISCKMNEAKVMLTKLVGVDHRKGKSPNSFVY